MAKAGDMRSVQAELKRVFLGWDQPVLHSACNYLEGRFLKAGQWDMDQVLIVIPSSWAGRRLGELLADRAQRNGWLLRPPEIVTVGTLPEKLYQARFPFASDLVQVLCWTKVLARVRYRAIDAAVDRCSFARSFAAVGRPGWDALWTSS